MMAAADGNLEIMRMLLKAGADVNYEQSEQNALTLATEHGHLYAVHLLLEHNVNIDQYKSDENKGYLLKLAIKIGSYDLVSLFIKLGFKLNAPNKYGDTVLHYVIENKIKYNMVDFLLQQGADPCLKNARGEDATMMFERLKKQLRFDQYSTSNYGNLFDGLCLNSAK